MKLLNMFSLMSFLCKNIICLCIIFVISVILKNLMINLLLQILFYSVSYFFYFQSQLVCWAVESCCTKTRKHFNENWCLIYWIDFSINVLIMLIDVLIDFWSILCQCFNWHVSCDKQHWLRLSQSSEKQNQLTLSCTL